VTSRSSRIRSRSRSLTAAVARYAYSYSASVTGLPSRPERWSLRRRPLPLPPGSYSGDAPGLGTFLGNEYASTNTAVVQVMETILAAATAQAKTQAQASSPGGKTVIVNYYGTQNPTPEQEQAMLSKLSAAVGVS
jgi:hypothetical protein